MPSPSPSPNSSKAPSCKRALLNSLDHYHPPTWAFFPLFPYSFFGALVILCVRLFPLLFHDLHTFLPYFLSKGPLGFAQIELCVLTSFPVSSAWKLRLNVFFPYLESQAFSNVCFRFFLLSCYSIIVSFHPQIICCTYTSQYSFLIMSVWTPYSTKKKPIKDAPN